MQIAQTSINQEKIVYDSNKENYTPSSYLSSSSKLLSHQKMWNDNNLKLLRDKKEDLMNSLETNDAEYYRLLKKKEELMYKVMERDSILFKEKAELEYMNDILREKENRKDSIAQNVGGSANLWLENYYLSENLFNLDSHIGNTNQIQIKLKNDLSVLGHKNRDGIICTGVIKTNSNTSSANTNEILEKEFNQDPELLMLYAAFNIV
jgi:hypothetical protein